MCPLPPFSMMEQQPLDVATPCGDMRHFEKKELTELRFGIQNRIWCLPSARAEVLVGHWHPVLSRLAGPHILT